MSLTPKRCSFRKRIHEHDVRCRPLEVELLELRHCLSAISFAYESSRSAGTAPWDLAAGDFNGDTIPDLAVADFGVPASHESYVLMGDGDGTLTRAVRYRAGAKPCDIHAADLDGDGDPDLAVANGTSREVSILLNNGDGTFADAVNYEVGKAGDFPCGVTAADLNGDATLDLAVGNDGPGGVSILLGVGDGTFSPQARFDVGLVFPHEVTTADLDLDGDQDLLILDYRPAFAVLWNSGHGTFPTSDSFALGSSSTTGVATGDVNGDGVMDFAVSWEGDRAHGGGVVVYLGHQDGTFSEADEYEASGPRGLVLRDLNEDGHLDLATSQFSGSVLVWAGSGDGTFADPEQFRVRDNVLQDIVAADFNGDDLVDLAVVGSRVSILLNTTEVVRSLIGDVDRSGTRDAADIAALYRAVTDNSVDSFFDLNLDGIVNADDVDYLVATLLQTRFGDANLDGKVDFADFSQLSSNYGHQDATWSDGDFTGDLKVDFEDFLLLAKHFGFDGDQM